MKHIKSIAGSVAMLLLLTLSAHSQVIYEINFNGSCEMTNASGQIVSKRINNDALIDAAMASAGITNNPSRTNHVKPPHFTLIYRVNGANINGTNGDTIEVVDTNGVSITAFPSFALMNFQTVTSADGNQTASFAQQVYTLQQLGQTSGSVGTAIVNTRTFINKRTGNPIKTIITGNIQFMDVSGTSASGVCSGSFISTRLFPVQPD